MAHQFQSNEETYRKLINDFFIKSIPFSWRLKFNISKTLLAGRFRLHTTYTKICFNISSGLQAISL